MSQNICPNTGLPCPKPKLFHITDIEKGKITQRDVCEDCIDQKPEAAIATMVEFIDFLFKKQIPAEVPVEVEPIAEPIAEIGCPGCGSTPADIRQTGKMGCMLCYDVFGPQLKDVIFKAHKSLRHVGKVPKRWAKENMTIDQMVVKIKAELNLSVHTEKYEQAKTLKEKLEQLDALREREVAALDKIHTAIAEERYDDAQKLKDEINAVKDSALKVFDHEDG